MPPPLQLFLLSEGTVVATALSLAAELGVADLLADGPRHHEDLAQGTGTHAPSLFRTLRLLSSVGVFTETQPGWFGLTALGDCLRTAAPGSMRSWLRIVGLKVWLHTYADALHSVRTGQPALPRAMGSELFDYLAAHAAEAALFNEAMSDFGKSVAAAVTHAYDFSGPSGIMDVGGGNGSFAAAILTANPRLSGVVFDRPHSAPDAQRVVADGGLSQRCEFIGGRFLQFGPTGQRRLRVALGHPRLG